MIRDSLFFPSLWLVLPIRNQLEESACVHNRDRARRKSINVCVDGENEMPRTGKRKGKRKKSENIKQQQQRVDENSPFKRYEKTYIKINNLNIMESNVSMPLSLTTVACQSMKLCEL